MLRARRAWAAEADLDPDVIEKLYRDLVAYFIVRETEHWKSVVRVGNRPRPPGVQVPMLEVRGLCKRFNGIPAVEDVSFRIAPGEILGYVGPNGAGKSTTVKMIIGLLEPGDGQVLFRGRSVIEDLPAFQQRLGYVPEEPQLYPFLSGREYLELVARLRGMPRRCWNGRSTSSCISSGCGTTATRRSPPIRRGCARRSCSRPPCCTIRSC